MTLAEKLQYRSEIRSQAIKRIMTFKQLNQEESNQALCEDIKDLSEKCQRVVVALFQPKKGCKPITDEENDIIIELQNSHEAKVLMELGYMMHFEFKFSSRRIIGIFHKLRLEGILHLYENDLASIEVLKSQIKENYEKKQEAYDKLKSDEQKLSFRF